MILFSHYGIDGLDLTLGIVAVLWTVCVQFGVYRLGLMRGRRRVYERFRAHDLGHPFGMGMQLVHRETVYLGNPADEGPELVRYERYVEV